MDVRKLKREERWLSGDVAALLEAVTALETKSEAKRFLRDLLTEAEIKEFANRWRVARMLADEVSYTRIEKETGMSSATIARIAAWMQQGMGGYRLMLTRRNRTKHHQVGLSMREG
ncbi:hypothetical protein A2853_04240 [Candidatus Kaiserbacteria bacterium RIFCSPHIGHO2_01_FULL_55_17]|uniref:TrpR like protein, YerC/YecD n=1 Tax=Candidatus Kaiserbacteria bacterium RIFCSPHIGHO2_01_FULL_55_17 TaxID=1798484 RepID=A0A1F6D7P5_9BACT|nr:MAG: hypothetical protein A2853_04240 [Candidatus Kaiserbacteria bacterium RIFCSPHIGHO2_01_FULL_55_17]